jgi:hypothetical protein
MNEWLNSMNLHVYFDNFLENGMTNLDLIINLANKPNKITYEDLQNIGINKPGHLFRILARIDYDANLISENLNILINRGKFNDLLRGSQYFPKGQVICCTANKSSGSRLYNGFDMSISEWLGKIGLEHLKKNFSHNGFDSMDYLLLQMFSSYAIDDNILENNLHIYQTKDRSLVLQEIEKNVLCFRKFLRRSTGESILEYEEEMSQAECKICKIF